MSTVEHGSVPRLDAIPGVRSVSPVLSVPFAGWGGITAQIPAEGQTEDEAARNPTVNLDAVAPNYFATLGIRLLRGRGLLDQDRAARAVSLARIYDDLGFDQLAVIGEARRADLVVYDRQARARLLVECKAPAIALDQATFEQVARYNQVLGADVLMVTNGLRHFVYRVVEGPEPFVFLPGQPPLNEVGGRGSEVGNRKKDLS